MSMHACIGIPKSSSFIFSAQGSQELRGSEGFTVISKIPRK